MPLYIDNLDRYSNYLVNVVCGNSSAGIKDIQGIYLDDSFSLDNEAGFAGADLAMSDDFMKGAAESAAKRVGGETAKNLVSKKFNTVIQSAEDWQGGCPLVFSIRINIFKNSKTGVSNTSSFKDFYTNLTKLTQSKNTSSELHKPQVSYYDSTATDITEAKLNGFIADKEKGLFTVTIGNWFKARLLQPTRTSMVLSSYTDTSGSPIYATVTMSFKSYRILTAEEWSSIILI